MGAFFGRNYQILDETIKFWTQLSSFVHYAKIIYIYVYKIVQKTDSDVAPEV